MKQRIEPSSENVIQHGELSKVHYQSVHKFHGNILLASKEQYILQSLKCLKCWKKEKARKFLTRESSRRLLKFSEVNKRIPPPGHLRLFSSAIDLLSITFRSRIFYLLPSCSVGESRKMNARRKNFSWKIPMIYRFTYFCLLETILVSFARAFLIIFHGLSAHDLWEKSIKCIHWK